MTGVPVKLAPYQSFFVVFSESDLKTQDSITVKDNFPEKRVLMTLTGPWNVAFDTSWGGPEKIRFEKLTDWSVSTEDGIKYYSGKAVYSKTFSIPESGGSIKKSEIWLNLGEVKNIASVKLNNTDLGIVWTSPWEINII